MWFMECCWNIQDYYEQVKLIKDNDIHDNDIHINDKNETECFYPFIEPYIQHLFHLHDYIMIQNDKNEEVKIYQFDIPNIIKNIIHEKIIIRDKKCFQMLSLLKLFASFEKTRLQLIPLLKNINIHDTLQKIDEKYIQSNKNTNHINISLVSCGIPNLTIYQYVMTFERKKCSITVENDCLFLLYRTQGNTFKLQLYDSNYDVSKIKYASFIRNFSYKNIEMKKRIIYQVENYGKYIVDFEKKYIQTLFSYHGMDFLHLLSTKYTNYTFHFCSKNIINYANCKEEKLHDILLIMT
jgi:hypothetical protein